MSHRLEYRRRGGALNFSSARTAERYLVSGSRVQVRVVTEWMDLEPPPYEHDSDDGDTIVRGSE